MMDKIGEYRSVAAGRKAEVFGDIDFGVIQHVFTDDDGGGRRFIVQYVKGQENKPLSLTESHESYLVDEVSFNEHFDYYLKEN